MQEEITQWREEGELVEQTDLPLVVLGVDGVITDLSTLRTAEGPEMEDVDPLIPDYMAGLVQRIVDSAEVWWCSTEDEDSLAELCVVLGVSPLPNVSLGDDDISDAGVRRLLWQADAAGRATYLIEDFAGATPARLPERTVVIDTTADMVLRPDRLPPELRG